MQNDDELVEKVARGIFEARSWWMDDPRSWERLSKDNKSKYLDDARAAIAVMREAGWTPPIFSHALTMGSAAYKVKLGPSGNLVYEPVDLYETEKPATSEGAG